MLLDISKALQNPGVEYPFTLHSQSPEEDESVAFPEGLTLKGVSMGAGESVFVRGELTAKVRSQCARCLEPADAWVTAAFEEVYVREPDPSDPEKPAYTGHTLDVSEQALASLWLALPMRFLCREDCLGLCPDCGANLNVSPCSCQKELQQHPFSALQTLLTKDEEV